MNSVMPPASADQALEMLTAAMGYLAAADPAAMTAEEQARCLRVLEQATSAGTAARTCVLGAFASAQGPGADAEYSPRAWLIHKTGITKGAAMAYTGWVRRAEDHPRVFAAMAAEELSESVARVVCQWTNRLPEECRDLADEKLVAAALAGMSLRDLAELFGEIYEQARSASPDEDKDETFEDRAVRLITTFQGAGVMSGDLTPECAEAVAAVLDALAAPAGAEDTRSQRKLIERRIPDITKYILDNENDWLFSSLTASFDENADFRPINEADPDVGVLRLPVTTRLLINDGQHRRAAIERALEEDPTLGTQTISVVLFPAESTERNQQMFSDLNRTVQKTPRSLNILYDHRDPLNQITLSVAEQVPLLYNRVEKEALSLAVRSARFITVSSLYDMLGEFLGPLPAHLQEREIQQRESESIDFLNELTSSLPQWQDIAEGHIRPAEARMEFINAHAVFFFAIGGVGHVAREKNAMNKLSELREIDWRRTNAEWQGICMLGPDIVTRRQTRTALRQQILFELSLAPSPPRRVLETGRMHDED